MVCKPDLPKGFPKGAVVRPCASGYFCTVCAQLNRQHRLVEWNVGKMPTKRPKTPKKLFISAIARCPTCCPRTDVGGVRVVEYIGGHKDICPTCKTELIWNYPPQASLDTWALLYDLT